MMKTHTFERCLVTGASGFIGKRLVAALRQDGKYVRSVGRSSNSGSEHVVWDLTDGPLPEHIFHSIDTVFHLAGYAHDLGDASKIEHIYQAANVDATLCLAEQAARLGVKRFVFVSSVKAGGGALDGRCMVETDQREPDGVYGKTKRAAELELLSASDLGAMKVTILRPSLVYGPNVKGNLRTMLSGIKRGWFPPLPDASNRRSMIHVDDLVRALFLLAEDQRAEGEIFIATDGQAYSSKQIYETLCRLTGKKVPSWTVPKPVFDLAGRLSPRYQMKFKKLFGDEYYSSAKLEAMGFKALRSLGDMNETIY